MTRAVLARLACCIALCLGGPAHAEPEADADARFRAALQRAVAAEHAGDPAAARAELEAAITSLEALGSASPRTRWSDDAWAEAARLAERAGDLPRARAALVQVTAIGTDDALVGRARAALARLTTVTGGGRWDAVVIAHDRLIARIQTPGDPTTALRELEQLVRASPGYPRGRDARMALAHGWEREGESARALAWAREAIGDASSPAEEGEPTRLEWVRMLIRARALDEAEVALAALATDPRVDPVSHAQVVRVLAAARTRARLREGVGAALVGLLVISLGVLARDAGSVRGALRRLVRPPLEVLYLAPVALVLAIAGAHTNPVIGGAVIVIALGGAGVAWLSGSTLDAARARGPLGAGRVVVTAALAVGAVAGVAYLALDEVGLDLVVQTWRAGHSLR